ncbi:MAG TPA: glycosyltransferase [Candidatus Binataceae bacterium]|nr:glycosyltransferase [Candidatus Binataceae bacterium]
MELKVSVIIPVRNGADTLARAIDSALGQEYDDGLEVVVANDGSTDSTAQVIASYGDRVRVVTLEPSGVSAARNAAVSVARGEYIAFLDADDEWLPGKLQRTVPVLDGDSNCVLVYHDALAVDATGRICSDTYFPARSSAGPSLEDLLAGDDILTSCAVMRRDTYLRCGGCHPDLICAQDCYLWLLAREQGSFRFVPATLTRYRFVLTSRREANYLKGTVIYERMVRERYGVRLKNAARLLDMCGSVHMARGNRAIARARYLAALRRYPFALRVYARLLWTFLPPSIASRLPSVIPRRFVRALTGPPGGYWQCIAQ